MAKKKLDGKIIIPVGVYPEKHEFETAQVIAGAGLDVHFIVPNRTKGTKSPDVEIDGVKWELKSPTGASRRTLDDTIKRALKQSNNIIIDLRRTKLKDCEHNLRTNEKLTKGIKRLKIINNKQKIIDILP